MNWLLYEGDEVFLHNHIVETDLVKSVKKKLGEKDFRAFLLYLYLCYDPDSVYSEMLIEERRKKVYDRYVADGKSYERYEDNSPTKEFIKEFIDSSLSYNEKFFIKWKEDVDNFLHLLSEIGFYIEDKNGNKTPNIKVKAEALKTAGDLIEYGKILEAKVKREKTRKKAKDTRRLFDRR